MSKKRSLKDTRFVLVDSIHSTQHIDEKYFVGINALDNLGQNTEDMTIVFKEDQLPRLAGNICQMRDIIDGYTTLAATIQDDIDFMSSLLEEKGRIADAEARNTMLHRVNILKKLLDDYTNNEEGGDDE